MAGGYCLTAVLPLPSLQEQGTLVNSVCFSFDPCRALDLKGIREALHKGNPDFDAQFKLCAYQYYRILKCGAWGFPREHFKRVWDEFFLDLLSISEQEKALFLNARPERYFPLQSEPDTKVAANSGFFNYRHVMPFEKGPWAWYEPRSMSEEEFDSRLLTTLHKLIEELPKSDKVTLLLHSVGDTYEEEIVDRFIRESVMQEFLIAESAVSLYWRYINGAAVSAWKYYLSANLEEAFDAELSRLKTKRFQNPATAFENPKADPRSVGCQLPTELLNAVREVLPQETLLKDFESEYLHPEYLTGLKVRYERDFKAFNPENNTAEERSLQDAE